MNNPHENDHADLFPPAFAAPPPPPLPLPPLPPPPLRPRLPLSLGEIISWAVILLTVAFIIAVPLISGHKRTLDEPADPYAPNLQVLLSSRYLVGIHSAMPASAANVTPLLKAITESAKTPVDQLRVLTVDMELTGKKNTDEDLDKLAIDHPELAADVDTLKRLYAGYLPTSAPAWQTFRKHYRWFADLAASKGKPPSDPMRAEVLGAARRTMATFVSAALLAVGGGFIGLVLLIIVIVFTSLGRLQLTFDRAPPLPADRRFYIQGFAFYLAVMVLAGLALHALLSWDHNIPQGDGWLIVPLLLAFGLGAFWPIFRGQSWTAWRATFGLHAGAGFFREIGIGLLGYIAGLPILAIGFSLTYVLTKLSGLDASHPITRDMVGNPGDTVLIFLLACVWAPITEEMMFRGAFFAHLRQRLGFWSSAIIVSLLFAAIHPQGWPAIPALASLAFVFAALREYRGSVVACMTAHALNNTLMLLLLTLMIS